MQILDCLEQNTEPTLSGREERKPLLAVLAACESTRRGERVYPVELEPSTEQSRRDRR